VRESWSQVVSRLEQRKRDWVSLESVGSVLDVARFVSEGPLATGLFGSVSLGGLLLAQTEASFEYPHYGPHLRVAPEDQGLVSFTYVDTQNKALQCTEWSMEAMQYSGCFGFWMKCAGFQGKP
jgi:hypothetical protein